MVKVHSGEEILPKASTPWIGCINVTDSRQTDRQTDRRICVIKYLNVTWSCSRKNGSFFYIFICSFLPQSIAEILLHPLLKTNFRQIEILLRFLF